MASSSTEHSNWCPYCRFTFRCTKVGQFHKVRCNNCWKKTVCCPHPFDLLPVDVPMFPFDAVKQQWVERHPLMIARRLYKNENRQKAVKKKQRLLEVKLEAESASGSEAWFDRRHPEEDRLLTQAIREKKSGLQPWMMMMDLGQYAPWKLRWAHCRMRMSLRRSLRNEKKKVG